ncbi:hypothetical protein ACFQ4O_07475 [Methylopila musalis]|uniref:Uncharacterized protein n=1 Tax=Methylopila musalis TaxID=1134781 RepID=A0ABW3Z7G9_9HYPH
MLFDQGLPFGCLTLARGFRIAFMLVARPLIFARDPGPSACRSSITNPVRRMRKGAADPRTFALM